MVRRSSPLDDERPDPLPVTTPPRVAPEQSASQSQFPPQPPPSLTLSNIDGVSEQERGSVMTTRSQPIGDTTTQLTVPSNGWLHQRTMRPRDLAAGNPYAGQMLREMRQALEGPASQSIIDRYIREGGPEILADLCMILLPAWVIVEQLQNAATEVWYLKAAIEPALDAGVKDGVIFTMNEAVEALGGHLGTVAIKVHALTKMNLDEQTLPAGLNDTIASVVAIYEAARGLRSCLAEFALLTSWPPPDKLYDRYSELAAIIHEVQAIYDPEMAKALRAAPPQEPTDYAALLTQQPPKDYVRYLAGP